MKAERLMQAWQFLPAIAINTPYNPVYTNIPYGWDGFRQETRKIPLF